MDSKKNFNKIKNNQISFDDVQKRKKKFLKELSEKKKMGKKNNKQKEVIDNLNKFYLSREEVINFF